MYDKLELILSKRLFKLLIGDYIVIFAIILTTLLFTPLIIYKHNMYNSFAFDLGIFAQALNSTLEGKFMYTTTQLYVVKDGNHMLIHFTPILLLLLPIYALAPSAITLLIIKSIITFSAAYPLYLLSKRLISNIFISILIVLIFLLYPLLHGALWFDFQFSIFFPLLIFLNAYAYLSSRIILYIISLTLIALTSEQGALYALLLQLIYTLPRVIPFKRIIRYLLIDNYFTINKPSLRIMFVILIFIIIYYIAIQTFIEHAMSNNTYPEFKDRLKAYYNFSILGYKGGNIVLHILTNLDNTYHALTYDYLPKLFLILLTYGILLFLPLQSIYGLLALPIISFFLLSNYAGYYQIGTHYPYYYLSFIFLGFIEVLSKINISSIPRIIYSIFIISIIMLSSFAPWSNISITMTEKGVAWYPIFFNKPLDNVKALDRLVELANKEGLSLVTDNHIFPHTTLRSNVYVLPTQDLYLTNKTYMNNYIDRILSYSDLILIEFRRDPVINYIINNHKEFGVYAIDTNALLLKRDYHSYPIIDNLEKYKSRVNSTAYTSNNVIGFEKGKRGTLVYGPYIILTKGNYSVTYQLRADTTEKGAIAILDVVNEYGSNIYSRKILSGFEMRDNKWHNITLYFNINDYIAHQIEFRVYSLGNSNLEFKGYKIERANGFSEYSILGRELYNLGAIKNDTIYMKNTKQSLFWNSKDISLNAGVYIVSAYLNVDQDINDNIVEIRVIDSNTRRIINSIIFNKDNLESIGDNWYIAHIPFTINNLTNIRITGIYHNINSTLTLSHINIMPT
jgi:uncharacterized membrane protein